MLDVADGRKSECLDRFFTGLGQERCAAIEVVAVDMWPAYLKAIERHLPHASVAFDKFHVAKHLGEAVDTVRKQEHRELRRVGDESLTRTKYLWLQNPSNMSDDRWSRLAALRATTLRTARAWAAVKGGRRVPGARRHCRAWTELDGVGAATAVTEAATGTLLMFVVLFFYLKDGRRIWRGFLDFVPGDHRERVDLVVYCTGYRITFPFFDEEVISTEKNG